MNKFLKLYILILITVFAVLSVSLSLKLPTTSPFIFLLICIAFMGINILFALKLIRSSASRKENVLKSDFLALLDKVPSSFFIISDKKIVFMNQSMKALVDFDQTEKVLPIDFVRYLSKDQVDEAVSWLSNVRSLESCDELNIKLISRSKNGLWLSLKGAVIGTSDPADVVISAFNISEAKTNELMLEKLGDLKDQIILLADSIQDHDSIIPLLEKILDIALSKISKSLFGSFLVLESDEYFRIAAYRGFPPEEIHGAIIPLPKSFIYLASGGAIRKTLRIDDIKKLPDIGDNLYAFTDSIAWELRSTLSAPIFVNGKLYGAINIDSSEPNAFDDDDIALMDFFKENIEKAIERTEKIIELKSKSYIDSLTGLYNRAYFDEAISEAIYQSESEHRSFTMAIIDLDYLKHVNDRFGHTGGDLLLRYFSDSLKENLPAGTIICRYGGDEFTLLFPLLSETAVAHILADITTLLKEKELRFGDAHIPVLFSFGVSSYDLASKNSIAMLERADSKMYEMKWLHKKEAIESTEANQS